MIFPYIVMFVTELQWPAAVLHYIVRSPFFVACNTAKALLVNKKFLIDREFINAQK